MTGYAVPAQRTFIMLSCVAACLLIDSTKASLIFTIDGVTVFKSLRRQAFWTHSPALPTTICHDQR